MAMSSRPGILKEWSLERFLPSRNAPPSSPMKPRPTKRARSPSEGPSLFSPTKRRILTMEGVFSPEKTVKSPIRGRTGSAALFLPQPNPTKRSRLPTAEATATATSSLPTPVSSSPVQLSLVSSSRAQSTPLKTPRLVPRDLPPLPCGQHDPGFLIHRDPHIVIFSPLDDAPVVEPDKEARKENVPVRRKVKKTLEPLELLEEIMVDKGDMPATPKKSAGVERALTGSPTPRRASGFTLTPKHSPILSKKQRRALLEQELDEPDAGMDTDSDDLSL
ncbi:hypothetical protein C8J56DRAFT_933914 [Mycena floridula]|nr:hypothetical protein C8J56DRAFT_933914 [Mycena floridula]